MPTQMEQAFECAVKIYHRYAILNPSDDYIQLKELKKMLKDEAQPFLKGTTPKDLDQDAYITQIFNKADRNKDGKISFGEWISVMALLLDDAHIRAHNFGEPGGHHTHSHGDGHGHTHGDGHGHGH